MHSLSKTIEDALERCAPGRGLKIKEEVHMAEIQSQIETNEYWETTSGWRWCEDSGIYCFRNDSEILYVGKATKFGDRISRHMGQNNDKEWLKDISHPGVVIDFISTKKDVADDVADIEICLIKTLRPKHNVQHNT